MRIGLNAVEAAQQANGKRDARPHMVHAQFVHPDDKTGSIEVGKYADLIVLDRNLFDIPLTEISETKVLLTLLEGSPVYGTLDELKR